MTEFRGAAWRKSAWSQNSGACVEVARVGDVIGIRDSKDPNGPILAFTVQEFEAFLDGVGRGEFDNPVS